MTQVNAENHFVLPIRIYYEDTDAGGVVYHSQYLNFMERARTEWLRELGFEQTQLANDWQIAFVVRQVEIDYLKPAIFNDMVEVHSQVSQMKRASILFEQTVWRKNTTQEAELLVKSYVKVVSVNVEKFSPTAIPTEIRNLFA